MSREGKFYKCNVCGNVVSLVQDGGGTLSCCGEDMNLMEEKFTASEGNEKHVPIIEIDGNTVTVKVGSIDHPMEENHYITLIQLIEDNQVVVGKRLSPGDKPVAVFHVENTQNLKARALCNIHGLWKSE
ncbi:desulfoferrodoxin [Candidatus Woesearchaeota archaeon]|nr:desulfoferrodoxin [Candidatus Woesearchaeota archaeon]